MEVSLKNKIILVTGAGQGIGNELCKRLSSAGCHVIGVSRSVTPLQDLKRDCPNIETIAVDLSDWKATRRSLDHIKKVDGVVNNAGIAIIKPFEELSEEDFDKTFSINAKAVFNVSQMMASRMPNVGGSIVNVSSLASLRSFQGHCVYSASKAAVDSITRSLALELGPRNIRVNSVNPTVILTRMGRENWSDPAKAKPLLDNIPLHRFGEVSEVVDAIIYLLSDKSSFMNGHSLPLEGGYCAC
ncbi:L-xylulose reductase [Phlebotomus papatasi]|uniref:Ketoreductase domain-containing protein n=1 Tax=Phlebotomus papatasi TaxID=29031 RepID=A0A1B0D7G5_PHLPP|nr:L-xylulose reductase [Phlebotomus papatasi]